MADHSKASILEEKSHNQICDEHPIGKANI